MKNLRVLFLLLTPLFSCQKDDDLVVAPPAPQTWVLVKATGHSPSVTLVGADLTWQETYVFLADSTFRKRRQEGPQLDEASGTYSVRADPQGRFLQVLKLTYTAGISPSNYYLVLNNCTSQPTETLGQVDKTTLISSSEACDGLRLEYKKQ